VVKQQQVEPESMICYEKETASLISFETRTAAKNAIAGHRWGHEFVSLGIRFFFQNHTLESRFLFWAPLSPLVRPEASSKRLVSQHFLTENR
jgi:hypothetical protein